MSHSSGSGKAVASIAGAPWLADPVLQKVLAALGQNGSVRVVGGAVRNALMGLEVTDIDLATTHLPEAVMQIAAAAGLETIPTGIEHGTVTILAGRQRQYEVTTLRRDVETRGRHATVAFTDDWAADAARRDFTINAIYCDAEGRVYDPVGGIPDIAAGRVRFVGDAAARIREDYLRILRFFRFSARYASGDLDEEGLAACIAAQEGLGRLSAERVRTEMLKLLAAPRAGEVLAEMDHAGILRRLLGERIDVATARRLFAVEAACGLAADPVRRLAALVGVGGGDAGDLKKRLRLGNAEVRRLEALPAAADAPRPQLDDLARKALLYRLGPETWRDAVLLAWARSQAPVDAGDWLDLLDLPWRWTAPRFPVRGRDLVAAGIAPGPEVGRILCELEQRWIAGGFSAGRRELLASIGK